MLQYLTALFYFDVETAVAACVLRATTKKKSSSFFTFFGGKKCIRVTWLDDFLISK